MTAFLDPLEPFRLTVSFSADQVVVGVRGEVDLLTAPELAAVMTAVLDRGHLSMELDLAGTTFMGVAGLRIIEAATVRLGRSKSRLFLRSPSAQVRRLLDITGLAETVHVDELDDVDAVAIEEAEGGDVVEDRLGPEKTASAPGTPVTVKPIRLTRRLRRVTAISRAPATDDQKLASIFATEASSILRDAGLDVFDDQLASRLADALRTRQVIARAQGVLMERDAISEQDAYLQLRSASRRTSQPLGRRAADIVASTQAGRPASQTRQEAPQ